jgi:hypothetical protein
MAPSLENFGYQGITRFASGLPEWTFAGQKHFRRSVHSQKKRRQPVTARETVTEKTAQPALASTASNNCSIMRRIKMPHKTFSGTGAALKTMPGIAGRSDKIAAATRALGFAKLRAQILRSDQ